MKYIDEYRDEEAARRCSQALKQITTKPWTIMEVCGGQTHAILRFALDRMLPPEINLVHGFSGGNDGAYQPVDIAQYTAAVTAVKATGNAWIDTVGNVFKHCVFNCSFGPVTGKVFCIPFVDTSCFPRSEPFCCSNNH